MPDDDVDELFGINLMRGATAAFVPEAGDDAADFASSLNWEKQVPNIEKPWMKYHSFVLVTSVEQLNDIVDRCISIGRCALDLETEGLDNRIRWVEGKPETYHKVVGYCLTYDGKTGYYVPVRHAPSDGGPSHNVGPLEGVEEAITRLCRAAIPEGTDADKALDHLSWKPSAPPQVVIYFWNAQFDHEFLFPVTGIDWWHPASFEDGMLMAFCLYTDDKALSLKKKAKERLRDPEDNPYEMIELHELFHGVKKDIKFAKLSPDEPGVLRYTGSDAICTFLNCVQLVHESAAHAATYRLEKQVTCVVRALERNRVKIDRAGVLRHLEENQALSAKLLAEIKDFARKECKVELDPMSPRQLATFLFDPRPDGMDITPKPERNEASGQYKTDASTLDELGSREGAAPILKAIVRYREVEKLISTYLKPLAENPDENDEVRVGFRQTGAASGRFSAPQGDPAQGFSGVPIHGIPGDALRRCFIFRPGYVWVKCDYAAQELRIAANVSGEQVWIKEFLTGTGDLHSITARAFFGKQEVSKEERDKGKTSNFALLYGGGPQAIMRATGCDLMEGRRRKQAFDRAVPDFAKWGKGQQAKVRKDLGVTTAFGRWIAIPDANEPDRQGSSDRKATNYPIQGSGADIMKISLVLLHKRLDKRGWLKNGGDDSVRMLLTVHDEIVFEIRSDRVADAVPIIVDTMEAPWRMPKNPPWKVPLIVEPLVGYNWGSGFKAERHKDGVKLEPGEVLRNGFVYSTSRKARTDSEGNVIELPDRDEVLVGKKFHIQNPTWLEGADIETPKPDASAVAKTTSAKPKAEHFTNAPFKFDAKVRVLTLQYVTKKTIAQCQKIMERYDANAVRYVKIVHFETGEEIVPPRLVLEAPVVDELLSKNLIDPDCDEEYEA